MFAVCPRASRSVVTIMGLAVVVLEARAAAPLPVGNGHVQLSYPTDAGPLSYQGDRPFLGANPFIPTNLAGAPNIGLFNSRAVFAWRNRVADFHPQVIAADETVISHAFFKINPQNQPNHAGEFFPGIMEDGQITIQANMQFDQPVFVEENTFLMHVLWDIDQTEQLAHPYHHEHNCHTMTDPFRNFSDFFSPAAAFADFPEPNYTLATVNPSIVGEGTNTLTVNFSIPYHMLMHLEEMGHTPPPAGLPAPHGFLEPFHIHFEYVVKSVPEPSVLAILTLGAMAIARRR